MSEKSIENITKSDSNFAQTFADHHLLPNMNFNPKTAGRLNLTPPQ